MIKVSVIVPVYNTEKFLRKCLKSIMNQNLNEIEIIVVNDGSKDGSEKIIISEMKNDIRIKYIKKINGGLSSARNEGLKVAKGEYILHIDSDDWIEKDYLKDMYLKAKYNDLDIVVSDIIFDWDNNKIKYVKDLNIRCTDVITNFECLNYLCEGRESYPCVWNKLFKRSLYFDNKIEHPYGISLGEDLGTTPKLIYFSKRIGKINKAYVHYIQNPESISNNGRVKKINELLRAFEILEIFFEEKGVDLDLTSIKVKDLFYIFIEDSYKSETIKKEIKDFLELIKITKRYSFKGRKNTIYYNILYFFPFFSTVKVLNSINRNLRNLKIKKK